MNNIELLKLAAKAVGYRICTIQHDKLVIYADNGRTFHWNPLKDDGDALRLAVALKHNVMQGEFCCEVTDERDVDVWCLHYEVDMDTYAATRRAIVIAAAEIGKAML